jgi:hypothetical protein
MPDVSFSLGGVRNEQQTEADRTQARMAQMMFEREMRARAEQAARQNAELGANLTREGWNRQDAQTNRAETAAERIASMQTGTQERLAQMGMDREDRRFQMDQGWRTAEQGRLSAKDAAEAQRQARLDAMAEKEHTLKLGQMTPEYRDQEFQRQIAQLIATQEAGKGGDFAGFDPKTKMPKFTKDPVAAVVKTAENTDAVRGIILPKYQAAMQRARDSGDQATFIRLAGELEAELRRAGADPRAVITPLMESMRYGDLGDRVFNFWDRAQINPAIEAMGY